MSKPSPLRAVIVDDEAHCIKTLRWEIEQYAPTCEVVATFTDPTVALAELPGVKPDVLFLDIEMPKLNGFDLLSRLREQRMHVVFTTAYSEYAVRAFKYSAVDYLLKPVDKDELLAALGKIEGPAEAVKDSASLKVLFDNLDGAREGRPMRLSLPTSDGWELVSVSDVIRCQSDGSYTDIHIEGGRCIKISRNLKQLDEALGGADFVRVHHSHLVNLAHVRRFLRQDGGVVVMSDGSEVAVARSRKEQLLSLLR